MRKLLLPLLLLPVLAGTPVTSGEPGADAAIDELLELYRKRDYFALRMELDEIEEAATLRRSEMRFLQAAVEHAFNHPLVSNGLLATLAGKGGLDAELASEVHRLRMANHLRLHDYGSALAAAREIYRAPSEHPPKLASEVKNTALLLAALEEVPAQTVEPGKTSRLRLDLRGRIPAEIRGQRVDLAIDTGANFSVLMKSEADRLGLTIRKVGLLVSTSIGKPVQADAAVAESVRLGRTTFRNVVFLVFPDELLSFPDGTRIPGLVGFPMLEALGEIRFLKNGTFEIPGKVPARKALNLALDDHEPLVRARFFKQDLVCRLDTGANRTNFYSPFYRRFEERIHVIGDRQEVEFGGVGGLRKLEVIRVPMLTLNIARADVQITKVDIYTAPLDAASAAEYLDCNIGRDLLEQFRYYAINFRDMALVLG